jgi:nucleoside-diphosphate-sugar epimerase
MKLLLTGATGFVGRNFLLRALAAGTYDEIYLPIRSLEKLQAQFIGDGFDTIPSVVKPIVGSARDWKFEGLEVDHLVHCAGTLFGRNRKEYFSVNVDGTLDLLRRLKRVDRAVLLSSQTASGPGAEGQAAKLETDMDVPLTWYGKSKLEMERQVAVQFPELNYVVLRLAWTIGPRDAAMLALFKMVRSPLRFKPGLKPKLYSYISVNDVTEAIFSVLTKRESWDEVNRRCYFLASVEPVTDVEMIASTAQVSDRPGVLIKLPKSLVPAISRVVDAIPRLRARVPSLTVDRAREILPDNWAVSSERFRKQFGWFPKDTLVEALRQAYEWYRRTGQLV